MPDNDLNLGYLSGFASGQLGQAQTDLVNKLNAFSASGSGSNLNIAQMTQLQIDMSAFTLLGQIVSAVVKDVSDTMKSSVRNIN